MKSLFISGAALALISLISFQNNNANPVGITHARISVMTKDTVPKNWEKGHKKIKKFQNWKNKSRTDSSDTTSPASKDTTNHKSNKKDTTISYQKNMKYMQSNKQYHPLPPKDSLLPAEEDSTHK